MTQNEFNVVLEQQYRKCADVLAHKKKEYTGDRIDRLSAFKIAASLQGCTPKAALAGMMSKHVVSLYDMCYSSLLQFDLPVSAFQQKPSEASYPIHIFVLRITPSFVHKVFPVSVRSPQIPEVLQKGQIASPCAAHP